VNLREFKSTTGAQNPGTFTFFINCIKMANGYILRFTKAQDFADNPLGVTLGNCDFIMPPLAF
jgi:hypothetical protein